MSFKAILTIIFLAGLQLLTVNRSAAASFTGTSSLKLYQDQGEAFLKTRPMKRSNRGQPLNLQSRFSETDLTSGRYITQRLIERRACSPSSSQLEEPFILEQPDVPNLPSRFFRRTPFEDNLEVMDKSNLLSARLDVMPWSGHYWPYEAGALGARHYSPDFSDIYNWKSRFDFIQANPAETIAATNSPDALNQLSPSEKYSLLIDDKNHLLTQHQWQLGKNYYDEYGEVEYWMGLCHGWAPAAITTPRPTSDLEVALPNSEHKIHFTPDELKALATYQWAVNPYNSQFVGARCNAKEDDVDEDGRIITSRCRDVNAGTWHIVAVNQLGLRNESFIIDAVYDYEVWNQPVFTYEYIYFNLNTKKPVANLAEAKLPLSEYTNDPFRRYRSPKAVSLVGIVMQIGYVSETRVTDEITDSAANDSLITVDYIYDLELDAHGNIVGGEWHTKFHPDFIWKPVSQAKAWTWGDTAIRPSQWQGTGPLPPLWRLLGQRAVNQNRTLLGQVVLRLIEEANQAQPNPPGEDPSAHTSIHRR